LRIFLSETPRATRPIPRPPVVWDHSRSGVVAATCCDERKNLIQFT
jgi:hypothetical protein